MSSFTEHVSLVSFVSRRLSWPELSVSQSSYCARLSVSMHLSVHVKSVTFRGHQCGSSTARHMAANFCRRASATTTKLVLWNSTNSRVFGNVLKCLSQYQSRKGKYSIIFIRHPVGPRNNVCHDRFQCSFGQLTNIIFILRLQYDTSSSFASLGGFNKMTGVKCFCINETQLKCRLRVARHAHLTESNFKDICSIENAHEKLYFKCHICQLYICDELCASFYWRVVFFSKQTLATNSGNAVMNTTVQVDEKANRCSHETCFFFFKSPAWLSIAPVRLTTPMHSPQ